VFYLKHVKTKHTLRLRLSLYLHHWCTIIAQLENSWKINGCLTLKLNRSWKWTRSVSFHLPARYQASSFVQQWNTLWCFTWEILLNLKGREYALALVQKNDGWALATNFTSISKERIVIVFLDKAEQCTDSNHGSYDGCHQCSVFISLPKQLWFGSRNSLAC
jgi:hypothetical protein